VDEGFRRKRRPRGTWQCQSMIGVHAESGSDIRVLTLPCSILAKLQKLIKRVTRRGGCLRCGGVRMADPWTWPVHGALGQSYPK
jgi:hypothetical protein